jgi:hypothetical protein
MSIGLWEEWSQVDKGNRHQASGLFPVAFFGADGAGYGP